MGNFNFSEDFVIPYDDSIKSTPISKKDANEKRTITITIKAKMRWCCASKKIILEKRKRVSKILIANKRIIPNSLATK